MPIFSYIKRYPLLIIILLSIPAFIHFFRPVYWNMHDDMQIIRQMELEKCIYDGQIPCRWTPDLGYGYGYPLFNYYPPLPYIVGQVFRTLGFSFINTVKLTAVSQILLSTLAMYYLSILIFPTLGAVIVTLLYTYAPYHAVNIYIRGAMNEAWAAVFFPLCFLFAYKLIKSKKKNNIIFLALSYAGLLLSHNPMALTFFPILGAWVLYWLITLKQIKNITKYLYFLYSGILSISLTAFFTLPVILENKLVQIDTMFQNYYHYSVHFASFYQLFFSRYWGDGPSVWGTDDKMSFMVGYLHWMIPVASMIILVFNYKKIKKYSLFLFLFAISFFVTFMAHERSTIFWKLIPTIQKIQFPWRFLNHSVFLLSLSSGFILTLIQNRKIKYSILYLSIILILLLNLPYFKFITSGPITDSQKLSGQAWTNQITSGIYDYLPKTASRAPTQAANFPIDSVEPKEAKYDITGVKQGTDWFFFNINSDVTAKITISQLAFPNFKIFNNGQEIKYSIEKDLGRMVININPGFNQIYVKLHNTPIRTISNYISLIAWISILLIFSSKLWKPLISKK
jgi:hypothetical protein